MFSQLTKAYKIDKYVKTMNASKIQLVSIKYITYGWNIFRLCFCMKWSLSDTNEPNKHLRINDTSFYI